MNALRVLAAAFEIETGQATTQLASFQKGIGNVKQALVSITGALAGAFSAHALKAFIGDQIELGSQLADTSARLGVSTDALQKFQYAAAGVGIDGESAATSLQFLNKNLGDAIGGSTEATRLFRDLGVNLDDVKSGSASAADLLPGLADAFAGMGSDAERTATAMRLFGRSGAAMVPLLKAGSAELAKMNAEFIDLGLGIEQDFVDKADAAGDALDTLRWGLRSLKTRIAVEVLPWITEGAKKFSGWVAWFIRLTKQTNIVKVALGALGVASGVAAAKMIASWGKVLGLFKGGGLLKNLFSLGSFGLIVGGILLIGLAIEDIVTMCKGGKSVLGDFFDKMGMGAEKQELIKQLTTAWQDMKPAIEQLGPLVAQFATDALKALPGVIGLVVDFVKGLYTAGLLLEKVGEMIGEVVTGGGMAGVMRAGDEFGKKTLDLWKGGSTFVNVLSASGNPSVPASSVREPTSFTRGDTTVNGGINVTVQGGVTNRETGRAVAGAVNGEIKGARARAAAAALSRNEPDD